ncbi:MAG: hypothetical protein Q7S02_04460 [bacterium]|nr:hypothetical protein [bacterium]
MRARWHEGFRTTAGVIVLAVVGAGALHVARAAEWAEPEGFPPAGNPPGFVWTQDPAGAAQVGGQFNISGSGKIGAALDVIGKVTAGSFCFGADCKATWAEVSPASVLLQAPSPGITQAGNLNISGTAIVKNLNASGTVTSRGCFGPVFRGKTDASYQGNVVAGSSGGYVLANGMCPGAFQHVCTTAEVLNSINCGALATTAVITDTDMWISNLAPSLPVPTNDCIGWTSSSPDWRGIKWRLNTATGGAAYAEKCNKDLPFACCS